MALKPNQGIAEKMERTADSTSIPVLSEAELKDHLQVPAVRARMKRVQALVQMRAQQKS